MKRKPFYIFFIFLYLILGLIPCKQSSAKGFIQVKETILSIPTYDLKGEDKNPPFSNFHVYPYPMQTNLSNEKNSKKYKVIILENDYIKIYICPDLGGKILAAFDKTNKNFDFIYHNKVIKPAIIGLRGAWSSGGMEWNFPSPGHTVNTFSSVNYKIVKNSDGSISCIVGTEEWVSRMGWYISITLYPNKSYIKTDIKLSNRTLHHNAAYFWINAAIHAFDDTKIIFPNTKHVFNAGYTAIANWPINNNKNISLYKNTAIPQDYFCTSLIDFNGIYNYEKDNGMVHYAPRFDSLGKKYWTWGTSFEGVKWQQLLTDSDGPYIEIQSGKLPNQSDTWIMDPHFVEAWTEWWYPIKNMKNGFVKANQNAAINFEQKNESISIALNTTSHYNDSIIQLLHNSKIIFQDKTNLTPKNSYTKTIKTNETNGNFKLKILDNKKNKILSYSTLKKEQPSIQKADQPDFKNKSAEGLFLKGYQSIKQNNYDQAINFLKLSLKEDPNFSSTLTWLGIIYYKIGKFNKAYYILEKSLKINASQDLAYYYQALSKIKIGKEKSTEEDLYKISKSCSLYDAIPYIRASLELKKNNIQQAKTLLSKSMNKNDLNIKNNVMLAMIQSLLGNKKQASLLLTDALEKEPLDPLAIIAQQLISQHSNLDILKNQPEYYLETALDFLEMNLTNEAISTLNIYLNNKNNKSEHPFIYYYLGYLYHQVGNEKLASKYFLSAYKHPIDYIFPFRIEDEDILKTALKYNPSQWKTFYYLGTLLTSKLRWKEGLKFFIEAKKLNPKCAVLLRNIGIIYWQKLQDYKNAKAMYQKATTLSKDPNIYIEFDKLLSENKENYSERTALFQKAPSLIKNNLNFKIRKILFYLDFNQKPKALILLKNLGFIPYEVLDARLSSLEREAFNLTKT